MNDSDYIILFGKNVKKTPYMKACEYIEKMTSGRLLALFHKIVQECIERNEASIHYLSGYPKWYAKIYNKRMKDMEKKICG